MCLNCSTIVRYQMASVRNCRMRKSYFRPGRPWRLVLAQAIDHERALVEDQPDRLAGVAIGRLVECGHQLGSPRSAAGKVMAMASDSVSAASTSRIVA